MLVKIIWGIRALVYKLYFKKIGKLSYIGRPIFIHKGKNISVGSRVRIYPGLRAELVNNTSFISIGNNVSVGQNCHFVSYGDNLIIGNGVTISGNVFITNCDHDYKGCAENVLDNELLKSETKIGDGVFIGYGAVILAGTVLGEGCVVGANSVVRGKFPPGSVIAGVPAKLIKNYKGVSNEQM